MDFNFIDNLPSGIKVGTVINIEDEKEGTVNVLMDCAENRFTKNYQEVTFTGEMANVIKKMNCQKDDVIVAIYRTTKRQINKKIVQEKNYVVKFRIIKSPTNNQRFDNTQLLNNENKTPDRNIARKQKREKANVPLILHDETDLTLVQKLTDEQLSSEQPQAPIEQPDEPQAREQVATMQAQQPDEKEAGQQVAPTIPEYSPDTIITGNQSNIQSQPIVLHQQLDNRTDPDPLSDPVHIEQTNSLNAPEINVFALNNNLVAQQTEEEEEDEDAKLLDYK